MNHHAVRLAIVSMAFTAALQAQDNPLSAEAKQSWGRTKNNLMAAAEKDA